MTLEDGGYHVASCEPAVSAFRRASGLHFAAANLSAAPELLLRPRLTSPRSAMYKDRTGRPAPSPVQDSSSLTGGAEGFAC
jgi:hypothetical protein